MQIPTKGPPKIFFAELGDKEINEAVNFVQKTYQDYMAAAWKEMEANPSPEAASVVAQRGFAFVVASGAIHMFLSHGAPKELEMMVASIIASVVGQMQEQAADAEKLMNPEAKA